LVQDVQGKLMKIRYKIIGEMYITIIIDSIR